MAPPREKARGRGRGRGSTLPRGGGGRDRSNYDGGLETQNIPDSAIDQPENNEGEEGKFIILPLQMEVGRQNVD